MCLAGNQQLIWHVFLIFRLPSSLLLLFEAKVKINYFWKSKLNVGFCHQNCFYSSRSNTVNNSLKSLQKSFVHVDKKAGGPRKKG